MKYIALSLIATVGIAASTFAGQEMSSGKDSKYVVEPCFQDRELQVDLFGTYNDAVQRSPYNDGFGGGIAVNYFFMRYLGIGVEGNVYDGAHGGPVGYRNEDHWNYKGGDVVWNLGGRLIARYPLELGTACISPYAFVGGGAQFDSLSSGTWLAGGGLEWRATPKFGVFSEGRYTWAGNQANSAQARVGIRFVF